jgi:hypothetical protein
MVVVRREVVMKNLRSKPARGAAAVALAAMLLAPEAARAQEGVLIAPVVAPPPRAPRPDAVPLDEHTANLVGANRFKVGVLALEYGITDYLSVGTDPAEYLVRTFKNVIAPNLHVKGMLLRSPHVLVSGQAAAYWANVTHGGVSGDLYIVPLTLFVSVKLAPPLWLHLEGAYNWSTSTGTGDVANTDVFGTVVMRTAQVGAMAQLKLSRVVALIARARYQFWETPIVLQGHAMPDPYTTAAVQVEAQPLRQHPIMAVAGVALTWKYVGVIAGGGWGHYTVPGANLALPYDGFVPEGSLWVLF